MRTIKFKAIEMTIRTALESMDERVVLLADLYRCAGFEVRIVGGAVRDWLMGETPKDIDLATTATPRDGMLLLGKAGVRVEPTGIHHGTISAIVGGEPFEITTLRTDSDHDGRRASVEFTSDWTVDAARRDFTFNAMSVGMDGQLHDPFDGAEDLKAGRIRFVGAAGARIEEDYLRILRFFRFSARMKASMAPDDLATIRDRVEGLERIAGERIQQEMRKLFGHGAGHVADAMNATGVGRMIGLELDRDLCERMTGESMEAILAAHARQSDDGWVLVRQLKQRWRLSNASATTIGFAVRAPAQFDVAAARRAAIVDRAPDHWIEAAFAATGNTNDRTRWREYGPVRAPVTGGDLVAMGITGPDTGTKLKEALTRWVDEGCQASREDLLAAIRSGALHSSPSG